VNQRRRVVITGLGVVAPNGVGKDAFWQNLIAGKSGIDWITFFDPSPFPSRIAGEVRNFQPEQFMTARQARELWRFSQFAVASSRMALEDAKFTIRPGNADRVAACFGTCVNGFEHIEDTHQTFQADGFRQIPPQTCLEYSTHAPVSHVSIAFGIKGPTMTLASGCSTGLDVIKWGADQIRQGIVDAAVVGSTEAPLTPLLFATFCALEALSRHHGPPHKACRPYDLTRDGIVLAEGGGALVLEHLDSALDRGAPIYAEFLGYGLASEALHLRKTDATGDGIARAIGAALASAHLSPADVDYIHGHGNSLPDYDAAETLGIKTALGSHAYSIPISSIKSMIGQPIAASGALQAIASALTLAHGLIPPTINYQLPDPLCDLDYVPNHARVARVRHALVNAHAAGGSHSVLVLGRYIDNR
jgi:3-oxoacyl-[acyl-carrier-protein] synthase II